MNSRTGMWMALGAMALPLLAQGIGGCTFGSPAASPIIENAYTCGCTCGASPRNRAFPIKIGQDDAEQTGATVVLNSADLDIGAGLVGIRFTDLGIPAGAEITSAFIQFNAFESGDAATNVTIAGELSTGAVQFAVVDNDISNRPLTSASVPWSPGPWVAGQSGANQRTPDITSVVQELVN